MPGVNFVLGLKNGMAACTAYKQESQCQCFVMAQEKYQPRPFQDYLFELDAAAITSLRRLKERLRNWQRNGEKGRKKQLSYILSHHLPKTKLAACTVNISPGQTTAKMLKETLQLLTKHMQDTHAYIVYMNKSTNGIKG